MHTHETLEFNRILQTLADFALSEEAKRRLLALQALLREADCKRAMAETTEAKVILDHQGSPPLSFVTELQTILALAKNGSMLSPAQLGSVVDFLESCRKMKAYLKRAEALSVDLAYSGLSFQLPEDLMEEITRAIIGDRVSEQCSPALRDIRRKMSLAESNMKLKLENLLRTKKDCFSDSHIVMRGDRYALPVKKSHRGQVTGQVLDSSGTGATLFIEPSAVHKLQEELSHLSIEEDNEIRKVLYALTALVEEHSVQIGINIECMEHLDFAFAKAKLSVSMDARAVPVTPQRSIRIVQGRHPLLPKAQSVPLDFAIGDTVRGIVITGPNTGGKTVALKTVGLLSLMAQCGLHVPVAEGSVFAMQAAILCDIGDGQSITENLSTFSAHITKIVAILKQVTPESLVLLDELGSGTDPGEGMGIAVAILEELRAKNCLFLATTHYPEIKEYARQTPEIVNARMDFDRETLTPLYRLQIGEAGASCALHIAERLGLPEHMLYRAEVAAYGSSSRSAEAVRYEEKTNLPRIEAEAPKWKPVSSFRMGDSVTVHPDELVGIVYQPEDEKGNLIVQIKGEKKSINHKRLSLKVSAEELYPEDYDFSIIFNTVEERRRQKQGYTF